MIRLGTVFSGIGAIEHALERLGIEHKINLHAIMAMLIFCRRR